MGIREVGNIGDASRYSAEAAEETLRELEAQYAAGAIEPHAYFEKKRSLVRLFLKSTTSPKRRRHPAEGPFSDADFAPDPPTA